MNITYRFRPVLVAFILALVATVTAHGQPDSNPCSIGWAQAPRIDPRNYYVNCFPEIGRMVGTITHPHFPGDGEEFGSYVYPLGDVNRDSLADWILTHRLADTSRKGIPIELLLYHGMRGGIPTVGSGQRIGPTELGSDVGFIAAGDWDADGYKDLATTFLFHGDTSENDPGENYRKISVVVFWGGPQGYSLNDTTRLSNGANVWSDARGISADLNSDGVDDLCIRTIYGIGVSNGKLINIPKMLVFSGRGHKRWGREGKARTADWGWWNPPSARTVAFIDQDGDRNRDLIFYGNPDAGSNQTAQVVIAYGKAGQKSLDTSAANIETVKFDAPDSSTTNGSFSLLSDISGDSIPELLVMDGNSPTVRVFIGLRGQRIREQYGTGNEPEHPDSAVWWGKPWARVVLPNGINPDSWAHPHNVLFDLGDANFDGANDIWMVSPPFLICYSGGIGLDNLIDGMADTRPGPSVDGIKLLGDIDGSGAPTFAVNYDAVPHDFPTAFPGGVKYFKMWDSIPWWGVIGGVKRFPPYTLRSTIADVRSGAERPTPIPLVMDARPNPSTGEVRLSWTIPADGATFLTISDESGRELERIPLAAGATSAIWSRSTKVPGLYLATLRTRTTTITTRVIVE